MQAILTQNTGAGLYLAKISCILLRKIVLIKQQYFVRKPSYNSLILQLKSQSNGRKRHFRKNINVRECE